MSQPLSQQDVCASYGSCFAPPNPEEKLGVALNTLGTLPLNALRHPAEAGTCGWFIWGGTSVPQDPEFFQPLHVHHLVRHCPQLIPFLALSPGWRVLLAPGQTEVWYDVGLLNV